MRNPPNDPLGSPKADDARSSEKGSERRCVLTGNNGSRDELVRLALSPDGDVLPDPLAKAPGRGAWIGVTKAELAEAIASGKLRGALSRAFKTGQLSIPETLAELTEQGLTKAFLQRLGLEMRSGRIILGSDRIRDDARMGKVAALFHASDASEDGRRKLDQAWRVGRDEEGSGLRGTVLPLDREALSVALGRDNVVHLALVDAKSAGRVAIPLGRLQTFLGAALAAGTSDGAGGDDAARAEA
ncbi:DUF448 domain-containing protein [Aurantiacibacter aquimixticola]|uniref:DUF448 domain-containing protein n=1 Tax=Aurantiacibacter aquimixticola TaxID=1958945 RepID=A0A419RQQ5_9SPHN|nr:DUF448 domain-containing protein [Aurantiacibacter aquimixticola]RJY08097.1 DUF448 domain-containing protein [Aurantiacibacter aquimixticola]